MLKTASYIITTVGSYICLVNATAEADDMLSSYGTNASAILESAKAPFSTSDAGIIVLMNATYSLDVRFDMSDRKILLCGEGDETILQRAGDVVRIYNTVSKSSNDDWEGQGLRDLQIDGVDRSGVGLYARNISDSQLTTNVEIRRCDIGLFITNSWTINNVALRVNYCNTGIQLNCTVDSANAISFYGGESRNCYTYAVWIDGNCYNNVFNGMTLSTLSGSTYVIYLSGMSTGGNSFQNNYIGLTAEPTIYVHGTDANYHPFGNQFTHNFFGEFPNANRTAIEIDRAKDTLFAYNSIAPKDITTTYCLYINVTSLAKRTKILYNLADYSNKYRWRIFDDGLETAIQGYSYISSCWVTGWDTDPTSLTNAYDGNWTSVTGTGNTNASGIGNFGSMSFDLGRTYHVLLMCKVGLWSNSSVLRFYWYYSSDNSTWVPASGTYSGYVSSTTERVVYPQVEHVYARYIRLQFYIEGAAACYTKIYEAQFIHVGG